MNEVETAAVTTENWADDVAPPTTTTITAPNTTQSFQTGGDWAAQVMNFSYFHLLLLQLTSSRQSHSGIGDVYCSK